MRELEELTAKLADDVSQLASTHYSYDPELEMWKLDRESFTDDASRARLTKAFRDQDVMSRNFTNSESVFQFYNLERLWADISVAIENELRVLHVCSEPIRANLVHQEIFGEPFQNDVPPRVHENMKTIHGSLFGSTTAYTYTRDSVLSDIRKFFIRSAGV